MSSSIKLSELNEFISCPVCQGYLIDATTVNECLHTFCKSCIVKHIKSNHNECPKCNTIIHERRPLDYIVHDRNKQDIVYKLVPQLYISELNRKIAVHELRGIDAITRLVLKKKFLHVALVQRKKSPITTKNTTTTATSITSNTASSVSPESKQPPNQARDTIYLKCPLTIQARHIRKLLAIKYQLEANDRIHLLYKGDIVSDNDQISNLAQSLTFCLHYEISRICNTRIQEDDDDEETEADDSTDSDKMSIDGIK